MADELVIVATDAEVPGVLTVRLNRPDKRNALNGEVFETPGLPEADVRELTDRLTALRTGLGDSA